LALCAVFASGRGSNFIAIDRYLQEQCPEHRVAWLVSDKADSGAVKYATLHNIPTLVVKYKGRTKDEVENEILAFFGTTKPALIILAGFMRLLGSLLIKTFPSRIINIHPSLLPNHPGLHGIRDSYESNDPLLGISIHYVDEGMDTGLIIIQESFRRTGDETLETIEEHIHALEHGTYPVTVATLLDRLGTVEERT